MKVICEKCKREYNFNDEDIILSVENNEYNKTSLFRLICRDCRDKVLTN